MDSTPNKIKDYLDTTNDRSNSIDTPNLNLNLSKSIINSSIVSKK